MMRVLAAGLIGAAVGVMAARLGGWSRGAAATNVNRDSIDAAPGIAALHRADSAATITGVPAQLRDLWDSAAVRITPGSPPTITRAAIYKEDSTYRANYPNRSITRYVARYPVLSVHGNTAVEWGGFDATFASTSGTKVDSMSAHGEAMRVLKRQADGSWKFLLLDMTSIK